MHGTCKGLSEEDGTEPDPLTLQFRAFLAVPWEEKDGAEYYLRQKGGSASAVVILH